MKFIPNVVASQMNPSLLYISPLLYVHKHKLKSSFEKMKEWLRTPEEDQQKPESLNNACNLSNIKKIKKIKIKKKHRNKGYNPRKKEMKDNKFTTSS